MADLTDIQRAEAVKIMGSSSDGTETLPIGNVNDRLKVDAIISSQADPDKKTFCVLATDVAIGNNKSMISILNATASGVTIRIRDIRIINVQNTAITGVVADFRLLRMTGHSAGTLLTALAHDTSDVIDSDVTIRTGATIAGESASIVRRWKWSSDEWGAGAQDVESNDHAMQTFWNLIEQPMFTKAFTLRAGEGATIKQVTNSTAGTFDILIMFTEE